MNKKDREEMVGIVTDALNDVMVPALDAMAQKLTGELASKKELHEFKKEVGMRFDSLDRKFDAQQERLDRHDKRITKIETKVGLVV